MHLNDVDLNALHSAFLVVESIINEVAVIKKKLPQI